MSTSSLSAAALFRLDGAAAMITGAGAGIGRIAALTLAEAGARVAVTDIDEARAGGVAEQIATTGGTAKAWMLDAGDEERVVDVVAEIAAHFGSLEVLVNNAGVVHREPTESLTLDDWRCVMRVNLDGAFVCAREAGRHMLRNNRGSIINVVSIMGMVGGGFYPNLPYHASKGGLVNMTRALAAEWAERGVRVNALAPTFVTTALTRHLRADANITRIIKERTPLGRFAEPEELAGAILFLASPASAMVTGHVLAVDGGWLAI